MIGPPDKGGARTKLVYSAKTLKTKTIAFAPFDLLCLICSNLIIFSASYYHTKLYDLIIVYLLVEVRCTI